MCGLLCVKRALALQKVFQHGVAVFGQDAFRVKLYAFYGQIGMAYAHDFAIICPSRNLQAGGSVARSIAREW